MVCSTGTFNEHYIKLGKPVLECSACWEPVHTGRREWIDLKARDRALFFAQVLGYSVPVFLFVVFALAGTYFYAGGIDQVWAGCIAAFAVAVALLFARAVLQVAWSLRRTASRPATRATN